MKVIQVLILITFMSFQLDAQMFVGGKVGGASYFGDMDSGGKMENRINDLLYADPAAAVTFGFTHNSRFSTELSLLAGGIKGDDSRSTNPGRKARNLNFFSPYYELALTEEFTVLAIRNKSSRRGIAAYLKVGLAGYYFNPKTKDSSGVIWELQPLGTEGQGSSGYPPKYSRFRVSLPFGGGLSYSIDDENAISLEVMSRYTGFDHLDDLGSSTYAPASVFPDTELGRKAKELSDRRETPLYIGKRGDQDTPDYVFSFMVTYRHTLKSSRTSIMNPQ